MSIEKDKKSKEYFFILCLKKVYSEEANDKVQFTNSKEKDNIPKCILTKEKDNFIVKIFKFTPSAHETQFKFEFLYDGKNYELTLDRLRDKTFLFDVDTNNKRKLDQIKIDISEKMNCFAEALNTQKESEKINILYDDALNLFIKKPSFEFLINIFVKIYNTDLCTKLLDNFNKKKENLFEDTNKENLLKYKFDFDQIIENHEEIISKFSLNPTDFYGLILCYLNICDKKNYKELFDKLSKKEEGKKIIFDIMIVYKSFFKKVDNIDKGLLNEFIKNATKKDFKSFKEDALFYLKDINTFIDIIENNKDDIIKIKSFEPIEVLKIKDDEEIEFGVINPKIMKLTEFSKEQKKLFMILNGKFWESLAKKSYGINRDNIKLCSVLRSIFKNYNNMVSEFEEDNKIKKEIKEIKATFKRGIFTPQIHKIIKEYIEKNPDVSNVEILELIKDYDEYYKNDSEYNIKQREPKILEKINLEKIKLDLNNNNENFIKDFKALQFEKLFAKDLKNYLNIIIKKIKKITDFDIIFKLININALGSNEKIYYINRLKNTYNNIEGKINDEEEENIKSMVNLSIFICTNENNISFLENTISKSKIINPNIKHKIFIGLINFCKENKSETIKNIKEYIIKHYNKPEKLKEFIDFIINLSEDDANNFIENIDDKYNIIEKEFYSRGKNLNIQLLNELLIKNNLNLKDDNKYIMTNIGTITKIAKDIEDKEIQFEYLKNFVNDEEEVVKEKLNLLTKAQNIYLDQEEIYKNIQIYYKEMKDDFDKLSDFKNMIYKIYIVSKL